MSPSEATALAELDRLAGSAVTALRDRIESVVPLDELAPLDQRPTPVGSAPRRRRALAVAAVFVVVVGVSAAVLATREDRSAVMSGGAPQYLLPGWLPEGLALTQALRLEDTPEAGAVGGDVVAYGRADAEDPWAGPVLAAFHIVSDPATFGDETEGETITVAGHPATLSQDEDGWAVAWPIEGGRLMVRGVRLSKEQVIAAAQALSAEPALGSTGLPEGFAEIARGPLDAAVPGTLGYSGPSSGLAVSYGPAAGGPQGTTHLSVIQRPATAAAVDLARVTYPDAGVTRVRGQHAVVAAPEGEVLLQWFEPGGQLVTLVASGLPEATVHQIADGMRPAASGDVDRLVAEYQPDRGDDGAAATEVGADEAATQIVVAEGEYEGESWQLLATDPAADARTLELTLEHNGDASGLSWGRGDTGVPLVVTLSRFDGGVVAVFGVVDPAASAVTIEPPSGPPVAADLHAVDGATYQSFLTFVLLTDLGDQAEVVARRADGSEIARAPLVPPVECADHPDGTAECGSAGGYSSPSSARMA